MKPQFAAYLDKINDYYSRGCDVVTGASSTGGASLSKVRSTLKDLDKSIVDHESMMYKWGVDTYGPAGVWSTKPDETNTVGPEQTLFKGYADFRDRWNAFKKSTESKLEQADMFGPAGVAAAEDDFTDGMIRDADKFAIEFDSWSKKTKDIFSAHGNVKAATKIEQTLPGGIKPSEIPWGTLALAGGAIALVGGLWYLGRKAKADQEEAAAASSRRTFAMPRSIVPTISTPPSGMTPLGPPPAPLPPFNLAYGSK